MKKDPEQAILRFKLAVQDELQERIAQYVETSGRGLCVTNEAAKSLASVIRSKDWNKEDL